MPGFQDIATKRTWLVPEFSVWGVPGFGETDLLMIEKVGSQSSIYFGSFDIGGVEQEVRFDSLIDHRGNALPSILASPLVIPRPKGPAMPFIVGRESEVGFKIARTTDTTAAVQTDLLVVEIGD